MQSSSVVSGLSFRQELREGQRQVFERTEVLTGQTLNVKLPTGYGKTFTACGVYAIRQHHHLTTRMLYVVPNRAQLDQFTKCGPLSLAKASVVGPRNILDLGFFADHDILRRHRTNRCQIFATTIQYLCQGGFNLCRDLLDTGQWMLCIDEYHHYGLEKTWGQKISQLPYGFLLAMSATPYRSADDSAFGIPAVVVTYRQGMMQRAIKPLIGHAYDYRIDAVDEAGQITTYTTSELAVEAGGDSAEAIERLRITKKMRWSPKYVSPLIHIPITRMQQQRTSTGQFLQVLVTAMCVSHAELVCGQLKNMFPELRVDWVGTGENGRNDEDNIKIVRQFCPPEPSDPSQRREVPTLDVLVHVGMAGEGLDAVHVSEVVLLRSANFNNQTNQIIGRASRYLQDVDGEPIKANVSFDGSTNLARGLKVNNETIKATGSALIDAMDLSPPKSDDEDDEPEDDDDFPPELPEEPSIRILHMELERIDSGDAGVQLMADVIYARNPADLASYQEMKADPDHPDWPGLIEFYKMMRAKEASQYDERAIVAQWQSSVESAVSTITGVVVKLMTSRGSRIERTLIGDIKKRINGRKKAICGALEPNVEVCKTHWRWTKALEKELRDTRKIPPWLC